MRRGQYLLPIALVSALLLSACNSPLGGTPKDKSIRLKAAARGLSADGQMNIGDEDRCPVCAMIPKKRVESAAAIELRDGRTFYFCGNGCMIRSLRHPRQFLSEDPGAIKRAVAREYFSGAPIRANDAFWVAGSDIMGPMGKALIPLQTPEDVTTFQKRHGGKHTFRIEDLTDEKWLAITGKPAGKTDLGHGH